MTSKKRAAVLAAIEKTRVGPSEDKLQRVRDKIREARDLDLEIEELEAKLAEKESKLRQIVGGGRETGVLCDMFQDLGITELTLDAHGNLPAYRAKLTDFYSAAIPKDPKAASDALTHIERVWKMPGLIKTTVEAHFDRGQRAEAQRLETFLRKSKFDFVSKRTVLPQTLTAEIRRRYREGKPLSPAELSVVGGYAGSIMKLSKED